MEIEAYQQICGSETYSTTISRPDTAYATSLLATFHTNPAPKHQEAVDNLLDYLENTKYFTLKLRGVRTSTLTPTINSIVDF